MILLGLNCKLSALRRKIVQISSRAFSSKAERNLFLPLGPVATQETLVAPQSIPQIDAPRLLIKNMPKPSTTSYQYPQALSTGGHPNAPPVTILPPRVVNTQGPSIRRALREIPGLNLPNLQNFLASSSSLRPKDRKLAQPYLNFGPGFVDVGTGGFSPLSFAAMHPNLAALAPLVPRAKPPAPLRVQLRDPVEERRQREVLTESERRMQVIDEQTLEAELEQTLKDFAVNLENQQLAISVILKDVGEEAKKLVEHKIGAKSAAAGIKANIESAKNKNI